MNSQSPWDPKVESIVKDLVHETTNALASDIKQFEKDMKKSVMLKN